MCRGLIIIAITISAQLSRAACFEFKITKNLEKNENLKKEDWVFVGITDETKAAERDNLTVTVNVPINLQYSDVSIFFANEAKEILQIQLNETVRGKFFAMPYRVKKEMNGGNVTITETAEFRKISGSFPKSWLPEESSKVSGAVTHVDGNIYNYYGIGNSEISIKDLLLLEEYTRYSPST